MPGQLLISDANVLFDMDAGGLLPKMFALDYTFAVPDILFDEELHTQHPELPKLGLRRLELRQEAVQDVEYLVEKYADTGASINDLVALALARQEQCLLLTGDAKLRIAAKSEQVNFHGTLWLIEQMVESRVITGRQAGAAYRKMREDGRRLPWDEIEKQLASFRK
jgi:predicted nucleic acid-binding protein